MSPTELWSGFPRGGYPELVANPGRDPPALGIPATSRRTWSVTCGACVRSAIWDGFGVFLRAVAARTGQLLNLSDISRDLGVAVNTARAWLSILEATHQVFIVRPYFANIGKRLVKSPRVYFADLGTLCHLTGLKDPDHAASGPLAGPLMEAAVLGEIVKTITPPRGAPGGLLLADGGRGGGGLRGRGGWTGRPDRGEDDGDAAAPHGARYQGASEGPRGPVRSGVSGPCGRGAAADGGGSDGGGVFGVVDRAPGQLVRM